MDMIVRKNPRKLAMPLIKETACSGAAVGALAATNMLLIPKLKYNSTYLVVGELAGSILLSNKYPCASASVAGGLLNALFTSLAALVTKDISLVAWNPEMTRRFEQANAVSDFPENLSRALGV